MKILHIYIGTTVIKTIITVILALIGLEIFIEFSKEVYLYFDAFADRYL
jgi:lipopolysaccharide export LptBFGC system permease protein LptF